MKNKILYIAFTMFFILNLQVNFVCGLGNIQGCAVLNSENDSIIVKGTVEGERANIPLTLRITDESGEVIGVSQTTASFDAQGKIVFEFEPVLIAADVLSGKLSSTISGHFVTTTEPLDVYYFGTDELLRILTEINRSDQIMNTIANNAVYIGVDISKYQKLNATGKALFQVLISREKYDLPADFISYQNKIQIKREAERFRQNFQLAIAIGAFASAETVTETDEWLDAYFEHFNMNQDDPSTATDETKILKYLELVKQTGDFVSRIKSSTTLDSINKVREYIYQSALLATIKEKHHNVSRDMTESFPELFPIDQNTLSGLSEEKQAECYASIAGVTYNSYEEVTSALNKKMKETNGGSRTTGSGGGVTGKVSMPNSLSNTDIKQEQNDEEREEVFSDLDTAAWACEAVEHLYHQGVINGKGEGRFVPNDLVTRAEFIKKIILAMNVKLDSVNSKTFQDVHQDDWFAPYIYTAQKESIVYGNELNEVKPNEFITRQDMTVLLYRTLKVNIFEFAELDFNDSDTISNYANEAVSYFYNKGIVKGIGDHQFGATQNATRAQAAQMLYNIIKA